MEDIEDYYFSQGQHNPNKDYMTDMWTYEQRVKNKLISLGCRGHYKLVIDEFAEVHQISSYALDKVILPELKDD